MAVNVCHLLHNVHRKYRVPQQAACEYRTRGGGQRWVVQVVNLVNWKAQHVVMAAPPIAWHMAQLDSAQTDRQTPLGIACWVLEQGIWNPL